MWWDMKRAKCPPPIERYDVKYTVIVEMRKHTIRRKARKGRKTKTLRRGGADNNNDPSYNVWSRMYGGPAPIANPNALSRMYGGPAPIVNAPIVNAPIVHPNQRMEAPNVAPAPNQNAPIVQAYYNNRHNANVLPIPAGPVFDIQNAMKRLEDIGSERYGDNIKWATSHMAQLMYNFIESLGDEQILTINNMLLYNASWNGDFSLDGYIYIITRTNVYMSDFRGVSSGIPRTMPSLVFKKIYQFAESLSAQLCAIFISYCKRDICLFRNAIQGTGHDKDDHELHRSKLEAIMNAIPSI